MVELDYAFNFVHFDDSILNFHQVDLMCASLTVMMVKSTIFKDLYNEVLATTTEGYIKVNTDAYLRPQFSPKGIGGIIRNATGNYVAGFMALNKSHI